MRVSKPILQAAVCMLCASPTFTSAQQTPGPHRLFVQPNGTFGAAPLSTVPILAYTKTTGPDQRVIAAVEELSTGFADSTTYRYSGGRGSRFNYQRMEYEKVFPNADPAINPFGYAQVAVQADSVLQFTRPAGGIFELAQRHVVSYGAGNRVDTFAVRYNTVGTMDDGFRYENSFDVQGRIPLSSRKAWNASTSSYQPGREQRLSYSAQHRVLTDSNFSYGSGIWNLAGTVGYTYNGSGQLLTSQYRVVTGGALQPFLMLTYGYDGSGRMTYSLVQFYNNGMPQNYAVDSMEYAPGVPFPVRTSLYLWDGPNSVWRADAREQYFINSSQQPDSVYTFGYDQASAAWVVAYKEFIAYNSDAKPVRIENWDVSDPANPTRDGVRRFYYETYQTTSVRGEDHAPNLIIQVYPNPVSSTLSVKLQNGRPVPARVAIYSPTGQLVQSSDVQPLSNAPLSIDVSKLPRGQYHLVVEAEGNRVVTSFQKR